MTWESLRPAHPLRRMGHIPAQHHPSSGSAPEWERENDLVLLPGHIQHPRPRQGCLGGGHRPQEPGDISFNGQGTQDAARV